MKYLKYIWQLPQHLLAKLILLILKKKILTTDYIHIGLDQKVYHLNLKKVWGVSLGNYILLSQHYDRRTELHEYGHSKQSLMLGWLYLIIVGLPSISMNILSRVLYKLGKKKFYKEYYSRWPENWADRLGGVER